MLKRIFNVCFFIFTHLPIGALLCKSLENLPGLCGWICVWKSLLEWGPIQIFVCMWYRVDVVIEKSWENTSISHSGSSCNLLWELLSKCLLLNLLRLAITKGMNTYWLKTFQLFVLNSFVNISKNIILLWHYRALCVGQWHKIWHN